MSSAICFDLDQSNIWSSGNGFTLYRTIHSFTGSEKEDLNTMRVKKKMPITIIFFFSRNIFQSFTDKLNILITLSLSYANDIDLLQSKIL